MCFHNHIIICSTALDCTHKFRNEYYSANIIAALSDEICQAHHLSVIERKSYSGVSYDQWQGKKVKPTEREKLCMAIDEALNKQPEGFDALMQLLEEAGWHIKRGSQIAIKAPDGKRFMRMDTLGESYSEENLRAVLEGKRTHKPRRYRGYIGEVGLLIDIEEKIRQGKGKGYERWAESFNIKAKSKTMVYITQHRIDSMDALDQEIKNMHNRQNAIREELKTLDERME